MRFTDKNQFDRMREARRHGDALMPVMNYCIRREDRFHALDCHWHSEMELFRVMQGTLPNVLPAPYVGLVLATIVNGVGGGLIINGQLVRGRDCTAGEYSFMNTNADAWSDPAKSVACQCSTSGLLSGYRARKGLPADAPMNGKLFFDAANAAEPEALEVLERFCKMVAVQIYNLTVLLDVEKVAIGGGISKQPLLLESLRSAYDGLYASRAGQAYMEGLPRCQIVPCAFSSEANQVGVAAAYFEAMQKKC